MVRNQSVMTSNPDTGDDEDINVVDSVEEMIQLHPLIRLFGDHAKTRIVTTLLDMSPKPLNPTAIVEKSGLESRQSWYSYRDELLESGLIVEEGKAGNSPLYRIADKEEEGDPRAQWLNDVEDYTGAVFRDGERPTRD